MRSNRRREHHCDSSVFHRVPQRYVGPRQQGNGRRPETATSHFPRARSAYPREVGTPTPSLWICRGSQIHRTRQIADIGETHLPPRRGTPCDSCQPRRPCQGERSSRDLVATLPRSHRGSTTFGCCSSSCFPPFQHRTSSNGIWKIVAFATTL